MTGDRDIHVMNACSKKWRETVGLPHLDLDE